MTYGLLSSYRKGISRYKIQEYKGRIWLTDNPRYIIETQCGQHWMYKALPIILEINIEGFEIFPHIVLPTGIEAICPYEYYVLNNIEPDRIKVSEKENLY